jgi:hypothetical protein
VKSLIVIICVVIGSLSLNSVARAGSWECLTRDCRVGNIITDNDNKITDKKPRHHKTRVWNPDGSQTIIDKDKETGTTKTWHPDGSQTIIQEEEQ